MSTSYVILTAAENPKTVNENNMLNDTRGEHEWRNSLVVRTLEANEQKLFESTAEGDLKNVQALLDGSKTNINSTDYQGHSILHIALHKNDENLIAYLLKRKDWNVDRLKDCALFAIKSYQPSHVNSLLAAVKRLSSLAVECSPCADSTDFPDYMTPLMLAAQCGRIDIVECLLYKRHHPKIDHPHRADCVCDECMFALKNEDPLRESISKLERYRGICSPAYICQTTSDPILMAFQIVEELRVVASQNRILLRKYEELIDETERFSADLMGHCRGSKEVKIVLNERNGTDMTGNFLFPRLILAVEYRQKEFVAQTNVQEVLESAWISTWYDWKGYSDTGRTVIVLGRVFMLPFLCIVCLFFPNSTWATFYKIPLNRMISSVASYLIFLGLLFWESDKDKKNQTRYDIQYYIGRMVLIMIFVISHMMGALRMWSLQGSRRYFSYKWNFYDLLNMVMFLLSFSFWVCALITLNYEPDLERKYWHYLDPQLLSEGFFCIATVMAFGRLLLLVQIHRTLGPMQVSLMKMTKDFSQFVIIFAIVIGSFTAGMSRLYEYYDGMKQVDPETSSETNQESSFVSAFDTFSVLFWGLFCMSSQDSSSVVIENLPTEEGKLEGINTHDFTQAVGYILFAVYTVLTVIVLLNMLIAAMSNTFVSVTVDNVDVEWIFGRTEVFVDFMSQTVLPPPMSILPTTVGFFSWILKKITKKPIKELTGAEQPTVEDSRELMLKLVSRYFSQKDKEKLETD